MKYIVTLNNKRYEVEVTETDAVITAVTAVSAPAAPAAQPAAAPMQPAAAPAQPAGADAEAVSGIKIKAPMPGTITDVKVKVGQKVKAGDVLFLLEAMKMENEVAAPEDGVVRQILTAKGAAVETDALLAVI